VRVLDDQTNSGAHYTSCPWVLGTLSMVVKNLMHEADSCCPFIAELTNVQSLISITHMPT
jgi:hypothetical protein